MLVMNAGVIWTAYCAPGPCATGCPVKVEPVCGNDGRSYANSCVATCADVYVKHQGYCDGEHGSTAGRAWIQHILVWLCSYLQAGWRRSSPVTAVSNWEL